MKKLFFVIPSIFLFACGSDSDEVKKEIEQETANKVPVINIQSLSIDEHVAAGTRVGTIAASDADNDELTFTINGESGLVIDEVSGEITVGPNLILDFEANESLPFTVSVFDGKVIVDQDLVLSINNINEYELLSEAQKETIAYFQYLTLWQAPTNSPLEYSSRWEEPMKLYLDGAFTPQFMADVEAAVEYYNVMFANSDFSISLVNTKEESNAHLFFGNTADLEGLWNDMFDIVNGGTFSGYAITLNTNSVLSNSRIWVSNPLPVLFNHELGHALGFGHSEKCGIESSFMCSTIAQHHDFLEIEKEIIGYAYANDMAAGLTAEEIEAFLANKMVLEN